ncbi:MAG: YlxR family protein [Eubacteriales bacterium]|nr:YlxR family protein [Eubacteriales bacterium]
MMTKKIPMRMCVACRNMIPKKELIRIVRSPEGEVSIDEKGKKSGRGAYLCKTKACIEKALKQKTLERALDVQLTEEVIETLNKIAGGQA